MMAATNKEVVLSRQGLLTLAHSILDSWRVPKLIIYTQQYLIGAMSCRRAPEMMFQYIFDCVCLVCHSI